MAVDLAFTLTANDIFSTLANMIISQEVRADNFSNHQTLVDKARVDGSIYGDKKLYYSVDALKTVSWGKDSDAANLLTLHRPADPKVQAITLDKFRQIQLTVDNYLTKRAWMDEGSFSSFNSVMLGQMRETKKIYDGTNYNVFIGTQKGASNVNTKSITLTGTNDGQAIAKGVADLLVEMSDYSRDYNDYKFMQSYNPSDVKIIWNSDYVNKIKKVDTPTIFHNEGLVDKLDEDVIPAKYFGHIASSSDKGSGKIINADDEYDATKGTLRFVTETDVILGSEARHFFAGEAVPTKKLDGSTSLTVTVGASKNLTYDQVYVEDANIIGKVVVKLPPYMSAFEVATSFFSPIALNENHYLTFGHNTLAYLKSFPFVEIRKA